MKITTTHPVNLPPNAPLAEYLRHAFLIMQDNKHLPLGIAISKAFEEGRPGYQRRLALMPPTHKL